MRHPKNSGGDGMTLEGWIMAEKMSSLRLAKRELRKSVRQTILSIPEESIQSQSRAVTGMILSLPEYQKARSLSVYLSMPKGEISTGPIVKDALQTGKRVFVPYIYSKPVQPDPEAPRSIMDMVSLHSLEDYETLAPDSWGIPTPSEASLGGRSSCLNGAEYDDCDRKAADEGSIELIIMPGMAFDKALGRLGHGKGYYDFFLRQYYEKSAPHGSRYHMPFLVGLALQEQMLPDDQRVPMDPTDWLVDALAVGDGSLLHR